jgi:16S rRNA (cytosine1402-N4)-methyltransferase
MREAVVALLQCRTGAVYVDGTVGGGGYAEAILQASEPDGRLVGLDRDVDAIDRVRTRLSHYQDRLTLVQANFSEIAEVLARVGCGPAEGIVVDLGISSAQLGDPLRGFSFTLDGPLDMRMDQGEQLAAADLVNSWSMQELSSMIFRLGEEKWASRIARAILVQREKSPIKSTRELADLISAVVPKTKDSLRIHPATRTFQALRMAVNRELESLEQFLPAALAVLKPGGRLCTVAFHSLEDRLVKNVFREWSRSCVCPRDFPQCQCHKEGMVRLLTRKVLRPDADEVRRNPNSRSARVRAVEKIAGCKDPLQRFG